MKTRRELLEQREAVLIRDYWTGGLEETLEEIALVQYVLCWGNELWLREPALTQQKASTPDEQEDRTD